MRPGPMMYSPKYAPHWQRAGHDSGSFGRAGSLAKARGLPQLGQANVTRNTA